MNSAQFGRPSGSVWDQEIAVLSSGDRRPIGYRPHPMQGRELPWFSALAWWQKVLVALLLFVVLVTFLLLPRSVAGNWIVSAAAIGQALIFLPLKWWQTLLIVAVLSAMLTALLLMTQHAAPNGVVAVGAVAVGLGAVHGWRAVRQP
jgi:hypothetical protein